MFLFLQQYRFIPVQTSFLTYVPKLLQDLLPTFSYPLSIVLHDVTVVGAKQLANSKPQTKHHEKNLHPPRFCSNLKLAAHQLTNL